MSNSHIDEYCRQQREESRRAAERRSAEYATRTAELEPVDRAALELAMKQILEGRDPGRVEQIHAMLEDRCWLEVAEFCSYVRQCRSLGLMPADSPPCHGDEDGDEPQDVLLRRMLDAGVSQYDPDPPKALKRKV